MTECRDTDGLLQLERGLKAEITKLSPSSQIHKGRTRTKEQLEHTLRPSENGEVAQRLGQMRLCLKLLRNLRLNHHIFDESALELWVNQLRAVQQLAEFLGRAGGGSLSGYFRQPTGAGKTVLFGIITRLLGVKTLVLVPRTNLVKQTLGEFRDVVGFGDTEMGRVVGGTAELGRTVTVATYQSHIAKMKSDSAYRAAVADCELVVCDEAHRSLGAATQKSLRQMSVSEDEACASQVDHVDDIADAMTVDEERAETEVICNLRQFNKALILGFTATPTLAGKSVDGHFGECIAQEKHSDMVAAGILVPYRLVTVDGTVTDHDLEEQMTEEREAAILKREGVYRSLMEAYSATLRTYRETQHQSAYPLRGVAFCVNIDECDALAVEARNNGLRCEVVTGREARGKDADAVIEAAERKLEGGQIDLIATVKKLAEGWNFKPANAAIWARACTSPADVIQGIGRTSRAYYDPAFGRKTVSHVFETRWELKTKSGKARRTRPLGIADALVRNSEDPNLICTNSGGQALEFTQPLVREQVVAEIRARYQPLAWWKLTRVDRRNLKFGPQQKGLTAVARLFGMTGDPVDNQGVHLELGRAVWGDEWGDPESKEREHYRDLIKGTYTPQTWQKMICADRANLKFGPEPKGVMAVARLFGVAGDPISNQDVHLQLGRAIWANEWGDPDNAEREVHRDLIKSTHTPHTWRKISKRERRSLKFGPEQKGLTAVARLFAVPGDPFDNRDVHVQLGRAIWGDEWGDPESAEREGYRDLIKGTHTPRMWRKMIVADRANLKFGPQQKGLTAVARLFGMTGDPVDNQGVHLELGRAVWGDEWGDPESEEREHYRDLIKGIYTPQTWRKMTQVDKSQLIFGIEQKGISAVSRLFGMSGDPVHNRDLHLQLGRAIWGDDWGDPESAEREDYRDLITSTYTPQTWVRMKQMDRANLKIGPDQKGITAVARLFGVTGNPIQNPEVLRKLCNAIWGDDPAFGGEA